MSEQEWKRALVLPHQSIRDAVHAIDAGAMQIALVISEAGRLLGTVTDGDVRRGILVGAQLDASVGTIMNPKPVVARTGELPGDILLMMKRQRIQQVPLVDEQGMLVGVQTLASLIRPARRDNPVVLMAGGLGSRLGPLTDVRPKPLLNVGDRPILESILGNFVDSGFRNFYISVNYKAEMVVDHFGDGSAWGVNITYLRETKRMGTAGCLSMLPERPTLPVIVMNGDILTRMSFTTLVDHHVESRVAATMCTREFTHTIPYGVVNVDHGRLQSIVEKPSSKVQVNAGIYVLNPELLDAIPADEYFDMPMLFERVMQRGLPVGGFPIQEYWLDIGRLEDFQRAHEEYQSVFPG
ncbi:nucleotidyltransferase family protein [Uliginosibacterium sp. H1]|uniref:nucleotidyltransferase family protein n=1 Tax=Uliginosibacterium sp. H1 TaxID=3114757 RepID=UPI002E16E8D8|nr:nucleotidyltransferase family protein [Uliginosibacterium sp. H1]